MWGGLFFSAYILSVGNVHKVARSLLSFDFFIPVFLGFVYILLTQSLSFLLQYNNRLIKLQNFFKKFLSSTRRRKYSKHKKNKFSYKTHSESKRFYQSHIIAKTFFLHFQTLYKFIKLSLSPIAVVWYEIYIRKLC